MEPSEPSQSTFSSPWSHGPLPPHVRVGRSTLLHGEHAFRRFRSRREDALIIGEHCTMDGTHFAVGEGGRIRIGDYCYFTNAILLCELELILGDYVVIGWNTTLADTNFHPLSPAERVADAVACSPMGRGRARSIIEKRPVTVGNDVWIGPNATILKGVRIGDGVWIEAGALVTRDVPSGSRVYGNPAQVEPLTRSGGTER